MRGNIRFSILLFSFACAMSGALINMSCSSPACQIVLPPHPDPLPLLPQGPVLGIVHSGATLFFSRDGLPLEMGVSLDEGATAPDSWKETDSFHVEESASPYNVRLFARVGDGADTAYELFSHVYHVEKQYPDSAGKDGSEAVAMDDQRIVGWATACHEVDYGESVDSQWQTPGKAIGPATGDSQDILCLGRGGSVVMDFLPCLITNGPGDDFAVFENAFSDTFLELARIEVSSDGLYWASFDCAYLGTAPTGAFEGHETTLIGSFGGKYRVGFGTPFDLENLAARDVVRKGLVDIDQIRFVRVTDVVGDGSEHDSFGNTVYDPYPTQSSAGFDLEAIGLLNTLYLE